MSQPRKRLFSTLSPNRNANVCSQSNFEEYNISPFRATGFKTENDRIMKIDSKSFNDPIHRVIILDGICLRIVDTYQFQRLHNLKQLGVCDFVFRGATHTRFTHSLGVAHLAERLARTLQKHQSDLNLTEIDITCIKIAGLCHDLGHGPFSHVFDGVFIKRMHPNGIDGNGKKWRHEYGSVCMFNYLLEANHIRLEDYGIEAVDKLFIEEVINGVPEQNRKGRPACKFFLYDIVNNALSGLDVDKLDYYQRDMRLANVKLQSDFERFIDLARVLPAEAIQDLHGRRLSHGTPSSTQYVNMICYPEKMLPEAVEVFGVRFKMHQLVYTHRSVKCVEYMVTDALELADPYIQIQGTTTADHPDGIYRMSECIFDMQALSNLKDSILDIIRYDRNPGLVESKKLLARIDSRDLYSCIGTTGSTPAIDNLSAEAIIAEMVAISKDLSLQYQGLLPNEYSLNEDLMHSSSNNSSLDPVGGMKADGFLFSKCVSDVGNNNRGIKRCNSQLPTRSSASVTIADGTSNSRNNSSMVENSTAKQQDDLEEDDDDDDEDSRLFGAFVGGLESRAVSSRSLSLSTMSGPTSRDQSDTIIREASSNHLHLTNAMGDEGVDDMSVNVNVNVNMNVPEGSGYAAIAHSQNSNMSMSSRHFRELDPKDIIVEKMHIHYGLGKDNPVARMRFFSKFASVNCIGREVPEKTYETLLPRFFEDKRVRVFCRSQDKVYSVRKSFEVWCKKMKTQSPFPSAAEEQTEDMSEFEEHGWTQFSQYD